MGNTTKTVRGIAALVKTLRTKLHEDTANKKLRGITRDTGISTTWLCEFRDGKMVGIEIINNLANYYHINYDINNFDSTTFDQLRFTNN